MAIINESNNMDTPIDPPTPTGKGKFSTTTGSSSETQLEKSATSSENPSYSENYLDFILQYFSSPEDFLKDHQGQSPEILNYKYGLVRMRADPNRPVLNLAEFHYTSIPKLFTLLDTTSLEASGITEAQRQPLLKLTGKGVVLGFIDTGIEYTHQAFLKSDKSTKIERIWDQTIQSETPPKGFTYGTEYTKEQINEALKNDNPLSIVPSTDLNGHGTFMAGVAGGSAIPSENFIGAAPDATLVVVKLKEAKQSLKDFFLISGTAPAYQENDIIMGVQYLTQVAREIGMPLVICLGLGTNQGDHSSYTPLSDILEDAITKADTNAAVAAGNEAGKSHHFYGKVPGEGGYEEVEINAGTNASFSLELWGQSPEIFSVSIVSPIGEEIPEIPARLEESQVITFILEKTVIYIDYEVVEQRSGSELILMRFRNPTPGIWKIRVYCHNYINGIFHMWLPITGFIPDTTVFLRPNPYTTLTIPSTAVNLMTVSTYNAYNGSLFIHSGRGYTRTGYISPDITAPGVDLYGPVLNDRFSRRTGSSGAAAVTAGGIALILNWGLEYRNYLYSSREVKNLIIRGAKRSPDLIYPNREWGYGILDIYNIFETIT